MRKSIAAESHLHDRTRDALDGPLSVLGSTRKAILRDFEVRPGMGEKIVPALDVRLRLIVLGDAVDGWSLSARTS